MRIYGYHAALLYAAHRTEMTGERHIVRAPQVGTVYSVRPVRDAKVKP